MVAGVDRGAISDVEQGLELDIRPGL